MIELSTEHARRLVVSRQGLHKSNAFGRGEPALLEGLIRLGYVQIDTISVINRAHHHTLWTRFPTYRDDHLDALQRERKVFEYWSHAAAYLPMQDYRFSLPYMNAIAGGQKHWRKPDKTMMAEVLQRIRTDGALKARDFEASENHKPNFWGTAKPAKIALEQLFIEGQLMISRRDGFQKVYDLPERVLPAGLDTTIPTTEEFCRHLIQRSLQAHGLATAAEIGYLRKGIKLPLSTQIQQMLADNEIVQVGIPGNPNVYYSQSDLVEQASTVRIAKKVHLLSPFDNLVIQRKRIAQLFDYDYQIECYVPEKKRKHGYFCLPILFGDEFVGRLDPKADRKRKSLTIQNLVMEKEIRQIDLFCKELALKIKALAKFNGCHRITIERCNSEAVLSAVSRQLAKK